jgi:hypothetical protein
MRRILQIFGHAKQFPLSIVRSSKFAIFSPAEAAAGFLSASALQLLDRVRGLAISIVCSSKFAIFLAVASDLISELDKNQDG